MSLEQIIKAMITNKRLRLSIIKRSHTIFFAYYFMGNSEDRSYYPLADFQREMFHLSEDPTIPTIVIAGFRGCGKSTDMATSFPLWAILGEQKIKYVLILSKTEAKAQMMLWLIKNELETNKLLKLDRGPFREERGPWNTTSIYLDRYNAKITAASTEQSIRSFRHGHHRPQLIICDDLEDLESVKSAENRDKLHNWIVGDVIPSGNRNTRLIVLGGVLHEDSLLSRMKKSINEGRMSGIYREYPILDKDGKPMWPAKYPNMEAIEEERKRMGSERAFRREMMLEIVPDAEQIILPEWLEKYQYEVMPSFSSSDYVGTFVGIDPAIGEKESNDKSAMVVASVFGYKEKTKIYIHPYPINERLSFNALKEKAVAVSKTAGPDKKVAMVVENVAAQKWLHEDLKAMHVRTDLFELHGLRKDERLKIAASFIEAGKVFFPMRGISELRIQLVGFGSERFDDLADAFSTVILHIVNKVRKPPSAPGLVIFDMPRPREPRSWDGSLTRTYQFESLDEMGGYFKRNGGFFP